MDDAASELEDRAVAFIEHVEESDAEADLADLYARVADPLNQRVDNIMKVHSLHPSGLEAHFLLYSAVMRGTCSLPKLEREMIALEVSRINECHY